MEVITFKTNLSHKIFALTEVNNFILGMVICLLNIHGESRLLFCALEV